MNNIAVYITDAHPLAIWLAALEDLGRGSGRVTKSTLLASESDGPEACSPNGTKPGDRRGHKDQGQQEDRVPTLEGIKGGCVG
jgi:hypothetical protein